MKSRSAWHIFHRPVTLPYILNTIWCMNIIVQDYESVQPYIWPQNKCRSLWPTFHGPLILSLSYVVYLEDYLMYEHHTFGLWVSMTLTFDLKINVGHCDIYFMVQWFCLIFPRLFDEWMSYFQIMRQCEPNWPQNKCRLTWPIFHGQVILLNVLRLFGGWTS